MMELKAVEKQQTDMTKVVRVSDETFEKIQRVQRVRESYGKVVDRAVSALLDKEKSQKK
jgi:hypothetical protein